MQRKKNSARPSIQNTLVSLGLVSTLGIIAMTAHAQNDWQASALEVKADHPLVKQFQGCVSAVGLAMELPMADKAPKFVAGATYLRLNDVGRIRDGYVHTLYRNPEGKLYIIQVGGIAGTQKVFGPLDPNLKCPTQEAK